MSFTELMEREDRWDLIGMALQYQAAKNKGLEILQSNPLFIKEQRAKQQALSDLYKNG